MITDRQSAILSEIIALFTGTHEPVASKTLQDHFSLSSATIRNDMAKLEQLGYLEKTHTSSGRIPSVKGFQHFVKHSLTFGDLSDDLVYQVFKDFDRDFFKLDDLLEQASVTLSDKVDCASIVLDVPSNRQKLTNFDMVPITNHDALAVFTFDESNTITTQFAMPRDLLWDDLEILRDLARDRFLERTVMEIHYQLRTEIPQIVQRYFSSVGTVLSLFEHIFSVIFTEKVKVAGQYHLLHYGDLSSYRFLEDHQRVAQTLRQEIGEEEQQSVKVASSKEPALTDLTVMQLRFLMPYRGYGLLSVLAPVDVNYQKVMSIIAVVGHILTLKLGDYYRYLNSNHYEVN